MQLNPVCVCVQYPWNCPLTCFMEQLISTTKETVRRRQKHLPKAVLLQTSSFRMPPNPQTQMIDYKDYITVIYPACDSTWYTVQYHPQPLVDYQSCCRLCIPEQLRRVSSISGHHCCRATAGAMYTAVASLLSVHGTASPFSVRHPRPGTPPTHLSHGKGLQRQCHFCLIYTKGTKALQGKPPLLPPFPDGRG